MYPWPKQRFHPYFPQEVVVTAIDVAASLTRNLCWSRYMADISKF
jgi:hypothetical protein